MKQEGIGFMSILALIFITLKLLAIQPVADWSWWLVLLPLYGGILLVVAIAFVIFLMAFIFKLGERARSNSRKF